MDLCLMGIMWLMLWRFVWFLLLFFCLFSFSLFLFMGWVMGDAL